MGRKCRKKKSWWWGSSPTHCSNLDPLTIASAASAAPSMVYPSPDGFSTPPAASQMTNPPKRLHPTPGRRTRAAARGRRRDRANPSSKPPSMEEASATRPAAIGRSISATENEEQKRNWTNEKRSNHGDDPTRKSPRETRNPTSNADSSKKGKRNQRRQTGEAYHGRETNRRGGAVNRGRPELIPRRPPVKASIHQATARR